MTQFTAPYITPRPIPTEPAAPIPAPVHVFATSLFPRVLDNPCKPCVFLCFCSLCRIWDVSLAAIAPATAPCTIPPPAWAAPAVIEYAMTSPSV